MLHLYTSLCVWLQCTWVIIYNVQSAHPWENLLTFSVSLSTLLLVHSLPLMPFLSLCLSLSPVLSVSNFLCVSVFLPLFPMCVSPCFLSSLLPSCHMFLHLSQFISLAHCLPSGSLQWLTAYKQRVFGYGLKATHNHRQAHSLSLTYKEDFTSHVGNLHTSICSLTLKFTYWM